MNASPLNYSRADQLYMVLSLVSGQALYGTILVHILSS